MKRLKLPFVILAILLSFGTALSVAQTTITVPVVKVPNPPKPDKTDLPAHGNRLPGIPIEASINTDGIEIPGLDSIDIISYEICDEYGDCIALFADEAGFIDFLFANTGANGYYLYQDETLGHIVTNYDQGATTTGNHNSSYPFTDLLICHGYQKKL